MTPPRNFCTSCGAPLAGMRFCSQCGQPVAMPAAAGPVPAFSPCRPPAPSPAGQPGCTEQVLGIIPFLEQGLLSVTRYTLIVTDRQLVFRTWDPSADEAMAEADDAIMQESCSIEDTIEEIAYFRKKDWSCGPWQLYRSLPPDALAAGPPGSIVLPLDDIVDAAVVYETRSSTQDTLHLHSKNRNLEFDLMYSQGLYLFGILHPLLGDRICLEEHRHRRRGLDRLISGQEYK